MGPAQEWIHGARVGYSRQDAESNLSQSVCIQGKCVSRVADERTSSPVQNMGHFLHGSLLASPSHVLRYGFRTMSGSTGGVSVDECSFASAMAQKAVRNTAARIAGDVVGRGREASGIRHERIL